MMKKMKYMAAVALALAALSCRKAEETTVIPVTGVEFQEQGGIIDIGGTLQLQATVLPSNATNKNLAWLSMDETVATVNQSGFVTTLSIGTAIIKAISIDGRKAAEYTLIVTKPLIHVTSISLNKTELTLEIGKKETLVATVLPENADIKTVVWGVSQGEGIVSVDEITGEVTALAKGTATVTAMSFDSGLTADCKVTVVGDEEGGIGGDIEPFE